jgi:hypothetical protein
MGARVPLAEAVEALRSELEVVIAAGKDRGVKFEATSIEVELQATVTGSASASAGIKWWLIDAGAEAGVERATTQTIKLTLVPKAVSPNGEVSTALLDGED